MRIDPMRLKQELVKSGMKQRDLAEKLGVTEVSVSRYMSGERQPKGSVLIKLAEVLSVTPCYLCDAVVGDSETAYATARGNILQFVDGWSADQKRELLNLLVS